MGWDAGFWTTHRRQEETRPLNGPGDHVALEVRRLSGRVSRRSLLPDPYVSLASWDSPSASGGILVGFTGSQDVVTVVKQESVSG